MTAIKHYIQYAVASGGSGYLNVPHAIPYFLPFIGILLLWGLLCYYRGNHKVIYIGIILYILVAGILPIIMYSYSSYYLKVSPFWPIFGQLLILSLSACGFSIILKPYLFKTDAAYQASRIKPDNTNKNTMLFPNKLGAIFIVWYLVIFSIGFLGTFLIWLLTKTEPHKVGVLLSITGVFAYGIVPYFAVLRLFPRCPYCKFGLMDVSDNTGFNSEQEKQRVNMTWHTFWQVLRFRPFRCRNCYAPFVLKKQDLQNKADIQKILDKKLSSNV